ncbi:hypothetical protein SAMN02745245_01369 [Anaerosphaera aminiphila DSM 21120]|uniref:Tetratricopeptide repeat-containing protein n=1 Tax=Anaerosphaera aminiphila DSM 21120 TaxID=1120995 RepID=A0A1M5T3H1_9FIRM|nr:hypothetical protein [Anaerosphaera aminiphila]SHH45242.1 hypothetical protein SAMN02745245_01369 [Anaerosphaera aminiphila DSM 21120]
MDLKKEIEGKLKNVVFLELKRDAKVSDYVIKKDLPLPINLENLTDGVKVSELEEKVNIDIINKAIVYLLGIDEEFKYKDEYIKILNSTVLDLKRYIISLSSKSIEEKNYIDAYIYIKSSNILIKKDNDVKFIEANVLESIYNIYFNEFEDEEKSKILNQVIKYYEEIIKEDSKFYLAYYRLGYIFRELKKYLKSKLYFEKFLNGEDEEKYEDLKTEVREVLLELDDYANIETVETYLSYGKFQEAYTTLQKISDLYPEKALLHYYFSLCQYNLGFVEEALESIKISLELEKKEEQFYNQEAMCYVSMDMMDNAIGSYMVGISEIEDSYLLNYNLGILLLNQENPKYKNYLKKAYQLNPNEDLLRLIEI